MPQHAVLAYPKHHFIVIGKGPKGKERNSIFKVSSRSSAGALTGDKGNCN